MGAVVFFLQVLLLAASASGQNLLPVGNLYGSVVDEQQRPLPRVVATLSGPGAPTMAETDARGEFHFLNLAPGTYSLLLSRSGFAEVRYESVLISVGKDTQIRATMGLAAVSEAVSVSGATPDINPRKTVTGANFDAVEMQEIPTSRDPWAILRQVPGVVLNQVNVGGNATGVQAFPASRGSIDIQYQLDGVTITDPVDIGTPTYFNFDSFQEIQIATGGSDLALRGSGVTLNLVTKRGSNELKGLAGYFHASDRWQSDNTPEEARAQGFQSNRTAELRDFGIEAGGPIFKDRLWAWGAWGRNDISLDLIGNVLESGQTVRVDSTLEQFNFKLDAQPTPRDSTTFFFQHGDKIRDQPRQAPLRNVRLRPELLLEVALRDCFRARRQ